MVQTKGTRAGSFKLNKKSIPGDEAQAKKAGAARPKKAAGAAKKKPKESHGRGRRRRKP